MSTSSDTNTPHKKSRNRRKMPPWLSVLLLIIALGIIVYGLFFFDRGFDYDSLPEGWSIIRPPGDVHAMAIRGDTVWVGGKDGVFRINRTERIQEGKLETDPPLEYIRDLLIDDRGRLWIGHANGLAIYDGSSIVSFDETTGLPDNRVNSIVTDQHGDIMIGTWKGAGWIKEGTYKQLDRQSALIDIMVNVMMQCSDGSLWFGSYTAPRGGISILEDSSVQWFNKEAGLPHNNITSIIEEETGSVWVGTGLYKRGGAARFRKVNGSWQIDSVITNDDGLAGEKVRSVFRDREQRMWFGSENDGLTVCWDDQWLTLSDAHGLSHPEIKCIQQDQEGNIWLGTRNGVTVITSDIVDSLVRSVRN